MQTGYVNQPIELTLTGVRSYQDIFNEIEVDVVFHDEAGETWRVPAFWPGTRPSASASPRRGRAATPGAVNARISRTPACTTAPAN